MKGLLLLLAAAPAGAEQPPPDYRSVLLGQAEAAADALIQQGALDEALEWVKTFRADVADDPRLMYEEALILRLMGRPDEARRLLERSVEADPSLSFAWYDLGEILLTEGDLEGARAALRAASDGSADHPNGWAGPFRLAELAAREGDAGAFDAWLKEALYRGFTFRAVADDPNWRGFMQEPALAEVLRRLATVYGNEEVLEGWGDGLP